MSSHTENNNECGVFKITLEPYKLDYDCFEFVWFTDQNALIGNEMSNLIKHQDLQMLGLRLKKQNMSSSHPLEVVGCGSETQLQVDENLNYLVSGIKC